MKLSRVEKRHPLPPRLSSAPVVIQGSDSNTPPAGPGHLSVRFSFSLPTLFLISTCAPVPRFSVPEPGRASQLSCSSASHSNALSSRGCSFRVSSFTQSQVSNLTQSQVLRVSVSSVSHPRVSRFSVSHPRVSGFNGSHPVSSLSAKHLFVVSPGPNSVSSKITMRRRGRKI